MSAQEEDNETNWFQNATLYDWWAALNKLTTFVLLCAFMVLLILLLIYTAEEQDNRDSAHHLRTVHFREVQQAIDRASGSGLPWYEYMQVPSACLDTIIVREEVDRGVRPPVAGLLMS